MVLLSGDNAQAAPGLRQYVIVRSSDADTVVDRFEAADWAPAILTYVERVRSGAYAEPVTLREARPSEIVSVQSEHAGTAEAIVTTLAPGR